MSLTWLIIKEFQLELRRKSVLSGIALYLFSLVFICYITFSLRQNSISVATWSALFWLVVLFSVVNSIGKSFIGEKAGLFIYWYSVASPHTIIFSKIIYNSVFCFLLSSVCYLLFSVFIQNTVKDVGLFFLTLILASLAFSSALTVISGIASKAKNSNILMAVLSFPVVIAILLLAIKVTKNAVDGIERSASGKEILNLIAINCILTALAYLLFPYIWRS